MVSFTSFQATRRYLLRRLTLFEVLPMSGDRRYPCPRSIQAGGGVAARLRKSREASLVRADGVVWSRESLDHTTPAFGTILRFYDNRSGRARLKCWA